MGSATIGAGAANRGGQGVSSRAASYTDWVFNVGCRERIMSV